jgi:hypothetical protein
VIYSNKHPAAKVGDLAVCSYGGRSGELIHFAEPRMFSTGLSRCQILIDPDILRKMEANK